jgi:hypothetical protein
MIGRNIKNAIAGLDIFLREPKVFPAKDNADSFTGSHGNN